MCGLLPALVIFNLPLTEKLFVNASPLTLIKLLVLATPSVNGISNEVVFKNEVSTDKSNPASTNYWW